MPELVYVKVTQVEPIKPTEKSGFMAGLLSKIIPHANLAFDHLYPEVRTWNLEVDPDVGKVIREVGLDYKGTPIVIGPHRENYGVWTDSPGRFEWARYPQISEREFVRAWEFCAEGPWEQMAILGTQLSPSDVAVLESALEERPDNFRMRLKLIGYLSMRRFGDAEINKKWQEHALWIIENETDTDLAGSPFTQVLNREPAWKRASEAWERILSKPDVTPRVIMNAARFFRVSDEDRSRALLEQGERLRPDWPDWAEGLGESSFREVSLARSLEERGRTPDQTRETLQKISRRALDHFNRALAVSSTPKQRLSILPRCAQAALEGGLREEAVRFAEETVAVARNCPHERHRPDFIHLAHIVKGRAALEAGDAEAACRELAQAARQGSLEAPVLRSFGPDFRLARLLLERGEKSAVMSYLDRCAKFWNPTRIAKWRSEIERGGMPQMFTGFDPNEKQ